MPPAGAVDHESRVSPNDEKAKTAALSQQEDRLCDDEPGVERPPLLATITVALQYSCATAYFTVVETILSFLRTIGLMKEEEDEPGNKGYAPLYSWFDKFYERKLLRKYSDIFFRVISTEPGAEFDVMERDFYTKYPLTARLTGKKTSAINMSSYNYLGFAQKTGPCADAVSEFTKEYGTGVCSTRQELGSMKLHHELEELVAKFVRKPAAMCFGMGFATNSMNIPALADKECLIISDKLNHTSIILGSRLSGASIGVFQHNNMRSLERRLRKAIREGQPLTHRPWKKIIIIVEGIYSMEGTIVKLPEVVRLKKKYKAYLYLDEAHSIGATGKTGRGITELLGVDPADVDIMMGTFTKSFGGAGGYIAASKEIIGHFKRHSHSSCYAPSMPVPVIQQVLSAMHILMGEDGTTDGQRRLDSLAENTAYVRRHLKEMGFIVYGDADSPVVPVLIVVGRTACEVSRHLLDRGVGIVIVTYPAVPMYQCRARFCISAAHTREMLDKFLSSVSEVGDHFGIKFNK